MSARKWNFYYDENQNKFTESNLVDTASLWIAIGLLWLSFLRIIEEHFPKFINSSTMVYDTDSYMTPTLVSEKIGLDWFAIIVFLICLWLPTSGFLPRKDKHWSRVCVVAGMVIPVLYIVTNFEKLAAAMLELGNEYLSYFNPYQGTHLALPAGEEDFLPVAFTAVLMIIWLLIWGISCLVKKRIVLVLFPICAVILELMVGLSPKENGLFFLFVAAFLLLIPKGTKALRHGIVIGAAIISLLIASVIFNDKIEELSADQDIVRNWMEKLKASEINLTNTFDFLLSNEKLDNHEPTYSGDIVFEMSMIEPPENSLYLRGFYGTAYKNGTWTMNTSAFQRACSEAGYSATEMAQVVSYMPYEFLRLTEFVESKKFTITYKNSTGDTAYTPYFFRYETLDENYGLSGDYLLKKGLWDKTVEGTTLSIGDHIDVSNYNSVENRDAIQDTEGYEYRAWYNEVAEAYAMSGTNSKVIKAAADEIRDGSMTRWERVQAVREYLSEHMSYSLKLDTLPLGADPVEYALTEGHEGYCMHYASAGALILKELGVPARYVSGYIVRTSDFAYDRESSLFTARVPDYNAHAWVEVYFDDIGWIPCEMTEGYNSYSSILPTEEDRDELEEISQANREQFEEESESEQQPSESEEPTPTESEIINVDTEDPDVTEEDTEEYVSETEDSEAPNKDVVPGGDLPEDKALIDQILDVVFGLLKILAVVLILAAVVAGILLGVKAGQQHYEKVLEREIKKNLTRRAVKRINRRIYRVLHLRTPFMEALTDKKYEKALAQVYLKVPEEDWARYMEIVKKAHYSVEDISTEEMLHCYKCYKAR